MLEVVGDIWKLHQTDIGERGKLELPYVVVTTNGNRNSKGHAVMGRGIAIAAVKRFPGIARKLGEDLKRTGNFPHIYPEYRIITLPTKQSWWLPSKLDFVVYQVRALAQAVNDPCDYWMQREKDIE